MSLYHDDWSASSLVIHVGEGKDEIRPIHSRDPGRPLLRNASLLIPLDGRSQSQLLVEGSRRTLQQGTNRVR